jgi:hypothetical protein
MKLHSDCEILTPADVTRLFLDRETERLLYMYAVHSCILDLVISRLVCIITCSITNPNHDYLLDIELTIMNHDVLKFICRKFSLARNSK